MPSSPVLSPAEGTASAPSGRSSTAAKAKRNGSLTARASSETSRLKATWKPISPSLSPNSSGDGNEAYASRMPLYRVTTKMTAGEMTDMMEFMQFGIAIARMIPPVEETIAGKEAA